MTRKLMPRTDVASVSRVAPVARLTARAEGERLVIGQGAEDEAAGLGQPPTSVSHPDERLALAKPSGFF